jgi:hypothetical protein
MSVRYGVAERNALCAAWAATIGGAPKIRVYSGTPPAALTTLPAGADLLVEFTLAAGTGWHTTPANGVIALEPSTLPLQAAAGNSGTATYYRIYDSAGAVCHEQGTVDDTGGPDALIDTQTIASGQNVRITSWSKTAPGA